MKNSKSIEKPTINILILAAAKNTAKEGQPNTPVCLAEINGKSLVERIIDNVKLITNANFVFTFLETETQHFHLDKVASLLVKDSQSISVPEETRGSACTALLAACQLDQSSELLIISANELVDKDLSIVVEDFRTCGLDAGTLTFRSINPRYSFVSLGDDGLIKEAAQRKPISAIATAGVFWFARTSDFVDGTKSLIRKGSSVDGSYFVASVFNELILKQKNIGTFPLELEKYIPLKTEQQIDKL